MRYRVTGCCMLLSDFVGLYLLERETTPLYAAYLRASAEHFSAWLHHPATLDDFTDDRVNRYLIDRSDGRSRWTIKGERTRLLALWRAAWQSELVSSPPRRVRKIGIPRVAPRAWTVAEMQRLLKAASSVQGEFFRTSAMIRLSRAKFWRAVVLVGYSTGLRLGDMERLKFNDVGHDGSLVVTQHKTGKVIVCHLLPEAIAAVKAIAKPPRPHIFGGVVGRRVYYRQFAAIVKAAGLDGSTRWLRRTSGTLVEASHPGRGHEQTGNTRDVFLAHYCDPRLSRGRRVLPPRLASRS